MCRGFDAIHMMASISSSSGSRRNMDVATWVSWTRAHTYSWGCFRSLNVRSHVMQRPWTSTSASTSRFLSLIWDSPGANIAREVTNSFRKLTITTISGARQRWCTAQLTRSAVSISSLDHVGSNTDFARLLKSLGSALSCSFVNPSDDDTTKKKFVMSFGQQSSAFMASASSNFSVPSSALRDHVMTPPTVAFMYSSKQFDTKVDMASPKRKRERCGSVAVSAATATPVSALREPPTFLRRLFASSSLRRSFHARSLRHTTDSPVTALRTSSSVDIIADRGGGALDVALGRQGAGTCDPLLCTRSTMFGTMRRRAANVPMIIVFHRSLSPLPLPPPRGLSSPRGFTPLLFCFSTTRRSSSAPLSWMFWT
eukprot:PhM_4_TR9556/c0_g1_i1/m.64342